MRNQRPALFRGRHFADEIIVLCVRWYLRFSLSYRDLEELMTERNLNLDHTTVWRWVQRYAPELERRARRELKRTGGSWRVDETYVRAAGQWTYLYRAVDSTGSAGINRHVAGDERALQERRKRIHPDPESCGGRREASSEA